MTKDDEALDEQSFSLLPSRLMSKLEDDATDAAIEAGAKLAGKGLKAIFDRAARKRPNGLVARFRRFFGIKNGIDFEPIVEKGASKLRDKLRK